MKKILFPLLAALVALTPQPAKASIIDDSQTVEKVGIFMRDLSICHQQEWRHLTIDLEYTSDAGGAAADVLLVKEQIRGFLEDYSNPDDFWEIMNVKLVHFLAETFPDITTMKAKLSLKPDRTLFFPRASIIDYDRDLHLFQESFQFTRTDYLICQETFKSLNLKITWKMKENPGPFDYPDYQWIDQAMMAYFSEQPLSFSEWKSVKPKLQAHLLEKFSTLKDIDIEISILQ